MMKNLLVTNYQSFKSIQLSAVTFSLLCALTLVLFYNASLWRSIVALPYQFSLWNLGLFISLFFFLVALVNILMLLLSIPYLQKTIAIAIVMTAASSSYFMDSYGIFIDKNMIQNTFETDISEATELLSLDLLLYVAILGIFPAIVIWRLQLKSQTLVKALLSRMVAFIVSFAVIGIIALMYYQDYASLFRNNRELRHLVNPINFISATQSFTSKLLKLENITPQKIAQDAIRYPVKATNLKPNLSILVVGETARAANFSLNGYGRNTNPMLSQRSIVNFSQTSACGTATATSLPCMFSKFGRDDYSHAKSKQYEGLLDVLSQVGISVLWRDNNSGCKGACNRVPTELLSKNTHSSLCNSKECFDEILLVKLADFISNLEQDAFIVLHQKGSHGPAYYQRYPQAFEKFSPICKTNQLQNCNQQEIVNAYDNTILYTDHFLNKVIEFLEQHSQQYNTAMMYISDHGESLGENGLYLHGAPYFLAPDEQTQVPFFLWFSKEYSQNNSVDMNCLLNKKDQAVSQDNLFHSILGLHNISTNEYNKGLDIFSSCRTNEPRLLASKSNNNKVKGLKWTN